MKHLYILIAAFSFTISIFRKKSSIIVLPDFPLRSLSLDTITAPGTGLPLNAFDLSIYNVFNGMITSETISTDLSKDEQSNKPFDISSWTVRLGHYF